MKAFNIEFYEGSKCQLVEELMQAATRQFSYVVSTHVGHVVQLKNNELLQQAYANAAYRVCATRVLSPVFQLCKVTAPATVTTAELSQALLEHAQAHGRTVCVLGCDPRCIRLLKRNYPAIAFQHHYPPIAFIDNPDVAQACLDFVVQHPADIIFFALGTPVQEALAMQLLGRTEMHGVGVCVGDALERFAETDEPASAWVQRLKLDQLAASFRGMRESAGCSTTEALRFVLIVANQVLHERQARKQPEQAATQNK